MSDSSTWPERIVTLVSVASMRGQSFDEATRGLRRAGHGNGKSEGAAVPQFTLDGNCPQVDLGQLFGNAKPQTDALGAGACAGAGLLKPVEDAFQVLRRDARSFVRHADHDLIASGVVSGPKSDQPLRLGELDGVDQQVDQHAGHLVAVAIHFRKPRVEVRFQTDAFQSSLALDAGQHVVNNFLQPAVLPPRTEQAALQLADVQQIVDHRIEIVRAVDDDVAAFAAVLH